MLEIARDYAAGATEFRLLALPDDPVPHVDAIVSTGHAISYLDDEAAVDTALHVLADALAPGGRIAFDVCHLDMAELRRDEPNASWVGDDWALITRFSIPQPNRFVREMTTLVAVGSGTWQRSDERHDNVLVDTSKIPSLLAQHGIEATVHRSFGSEENPAWLRVVVGRKAER
jgi:hypothetical protein